MCSCNIFINNFPFGDIVNLIHNCLKRIFKYINDKVTFLNKQAKGIEQMVGIYKTLIAKINVLSFAHKLLFRSD